MMVRCIQCRKYAERVTKLRGYCPNCGGWNSMVRVNAQGLKQAAAKKIKLSEKGSR